MVTGAIIAAAVGIAAGAGVSAYNAHEQRKAAKQANRLQAEANRKTEELAKAQAGATPQQRFAAESLARAERARKGIRQTLLTSSSGNPDTKLGGAA